MGGIPSIPKVETDGGEFFYYDQENSDAGYKTVYLKGAETPSGLLKFPADLEVGDAFVINGVTPVGYNGKFTAISVSKTSPFSVSYESTFDEPITQDGWFSRSAYSITASIKSASSYTDESSGKHFAVLTLRSLLNVAVGDSIYVTGVTLEGYNHVIEYDEDDQIVSQEPWIVTDVTSFEPFTVTYEIPNKLTNSGAANAYVTVPTAKVAYDPGDWGNAGVVGAVGGLNQNYVEGFLQNQFLGASNWFNLIAEVWEGLDNALSLPVAIIKKIIEGLILNPIDNLFDLLANIFGVPEPNIDTVEGLLETLGLDSPQGVFETLGKIGEWLFSGLKALLDFFQDPVTGLINISQAVVDTASDWFESGSEFLTNLLAQIVSWINTPPAELLDALLALARGWVSQGGEIIWDIVGGLLGPVDVALDFIGNLLKSLFGAGFDDALSFIENILKSIFGVSFDDALGFVDNLIKSLFGQVDSALDFVGNLLKSLFGGTFDDALSFIGNVLKAIFGSGFDDAIGFVGNLIKSLFGQFNSALDFVGNLLQALFGGTFDDALSFIENLFKAIFGGSFNQALDFIGNLLNSLFGGTFDNALTFLQNLFKAIFGGSFDSALDFVGNLIKSLLGGFDQALDFVGNLLKSLFGSGFSNALSFIENILKAIFGGGFDQALDFIGNLIKSLLGGFDETLTFIGNLLSSLFGDTFDQALSFLGNLINSLLGGFDNALNFVGNLLQTLFGESFDTALTFIGNVFKSIFGGSFDDALDFVENLIKSLFGTIDEGLNFIGNLAKTIFGDAFDSAIGFVENIVKGFGGSFNSALTILENVVNAVLGTDLLDWINRNLIQPVIGALTGGVSLDIGALGVWARGLLTGESRIPANNLFGQVSSSLFGIIPVSHISNEQPNLLTQGGFDSAEMVSAADGWTWDSSTSYTGGGGALSVTANGTVKVIYCNQSIPVSSGDKVALTAFYKTSGYAGSGTPILLSLIPFAGSDQQTAVTIGAGGIAGNWTQLYGNTYVVPSGVTSLRVRLAVSSAASAGTIWFDDVRLAKTGLLQQGLVERLVDAWNNFWNSIFGGSETGKTVDDIYIAGAALTNTASTAFTNANDALSQLGQLIWGLLNAPATILGNIGAVIIDGIASIGDFLAGLWNSLTGNSSSEATVSQVATAAAAVTSTASAASTSADTANAGLQTTWNDLYDAFNGTSGSTGKTSANARERGAAVRSTAVTADANALTGIANAAAAQTSANTADGKAVAAQATANTATTNAATADAKAVVGQTLAKSQIATSDGNMASDPGFELGLLVGTNAVRSTESPRTGTYSAKVTMPGNYYAFIYPVVDNAYVLNVECNPGDTYYIEFWVKGLSSNVGSYSVWFQTSWYRVGLTTVATTCATTASSTLNDDQWHKLSGYVTAPADSYRAQFYITFAIGMPAGTTFYVDDVKLYQVTRSQQITDAVYQGVLGGTSTYNTISSVKTNVASVLSTANTGVTNAATAQAAADTAQTLLNAAITSGANLVPDPGFEDASLDDARKLTSDSLSTWWTAVTDVVHSGSRAMEIKIWGSPAYPSLNLVPSLKPGWSNTPSIRIPCRTGQVFYLSQWVYLRSPNSGTREMNLYLATFNGAGTIQYQYVQAFPPLDTWTKIEGYFVVNRADVVSVAPLFGAFRPGQELYSRAVVDDVVMIDVTDAYYAQQDADAAQATANTAETNAETADGKAVAAQTRADNVMLGGDNLIPNAGFEDTSYFLYNTGGSYSTEQARSGSRSLKLVAGYSFLTNTSTGPYRIPAKPSEVFYFSAWVYGHASNTSTHATGLYFQLAVHDKAGGVITYNQYTFSVSPAMNGVWTKLEGYLQISSNAGVATVRPSWSNNTGSSDIFYLDDVVLLRATDAYNAKVAADEAQATGQGIIDGAYQAVNGGTSTGNTLDSVKTNIGAVLSKANEGITNAATAQNTADTAAGTAQLALKAGVNLLPNGGFEDPSIGNDANGVRTADFARTGMYSLRLTGNGTYPYSYLTRDSSGPYWLPAQPSSVYRFTVWVRGAASNAETEVSAIRLGIACDSTSTVYYHVQDFDISPALNSVWTKFEAYIQITSDPDAYRIKPYVQLKPVINSDVFYFDDLSVELVTDAYNAQLEAAAAASAASDAQLAADTVDGKRILINQALFGQDDPAASIAKSKVDGLDGNLSDLSDAAAAAAQKAVDINQSLYGQDTPAATIDQNKVYNLTTALSEKLTASSDLNATKLTSGTLPVARVADSSLPQAKTAGLKTTLVSKYNQVSNPGFEDTSFYLGQATYSTEVVRPNSGARSAKIVGTGGGQWAYLATSDTAIAPPAAGPGDVIYMECWIYGSTSNTLSSGGFYLYAQGFTGANGNVENLHAGGISATPALNGVWTKWSGYRKLEHADIRKVQLGVYCTPASGQIYYLDDPVVRFVTDANEINRALYGPNATAPGTEILTSAVPYGIDATKLSGTLADDRIPTLQTSKVSGLNDSLGDLDQKTIDINQALFDQNTPGTAIAQGKVDGLPNDARVDTTLGDHSAKIQELEAEAETAANQGVRIAVNFSDYPDGAMPDNFTVLYNGTGTSDIQVSNGMAGWVEGSGADRDAKIIYTGDPNDTPDDVLLTDFQKIRGTLGGIPALPASGYATGPRFWAMGRINNTFSTYAQANTFVWARAYWKQNLLLRGQMGCTINGTEYLWVDDIPLTWSMDMTFLVGVGGNARSYQVLSGSTLVASFEENGYGINPANGATVAVPYSSFGSGYRRWGSLSEIRYQSGDLKASGPVSSVVVSDNITPTYKGSVARMSCTSATAQSVSTGETAVPGNFFAVDFESLDIDADSSDGTFTVTKSKMYLVAARIRMTGYIDNIFSVNLQKYDDFQSDYVTVQRGETVWPSDAFYNSSTNLNGMAMTGNWLQYLEAGDKIRLSIQRGPGNTAEKYINGSTDGEETYFTISALQ